jgi:hypothetical protein
MEESKTRKLNKWWLVGIGAIILLGTVYLIASAAPVPFRIITEYPVGMLVDEAEKMHECAECHESEDFHSCETCHNEHGSAVFAGLNFYSSIHLTGDVPEGKFIPTNHVFLVNGQTIGLITIDDFLERFGIDEYQTVTFASNDGGFTTISKDQLGETSFLLPFQNGVRFADEKIHISTWIKNISRIIVVGNYQDLIIGDRAYSLGELMLLDTVRFTVEQAQVMLRSELDGIIRNGFTAERLEGIELVSLLDTLPGIVYRIGLKNGDSVERTIEELEGSKLVQIGKELTLVFPEKSRNQWLYGVSSITEEKE